MTDGAGEAPLPQALAAALAAFPAGASLLRMDPRATRIKGGSTNDTWRVTATGADWVVRLGTGDDARLAVDRHGEAAVLAQVTADGYCPPLVCVMPERALLVTEFVASTPLAARAVHEPAFLHRMGRRLRSLHALPWSAAVPQLELHDVYAHYLEIAAPQHAPVPRAELATVLRRQLLGYAPQRRALCHHDLHRDNVLDVEPLRFVDWEYAAVSDPLLDLAAFARYEELGPAAVAALWAGYGPAPGLDDANYARALLLTDCLRALWLDAADAWHSVEPAARAGLCARLAAAI